VRVGVTKRGLCLVIVKAMVRLLAHFAPLSMCNGDLLRKACLLGNGVVIR
jgi:hypothetical protein